MKRTYCPTLLYLEKIKKPTFSELKVGSYYVSEQMAYLILKKEENVFCVLTDEGKILKSRSFQNGNEIFYVEELK